MKQKRIAVLIPCYNEALTIGRVVDDWKKALPGAIVYVYDNNSSDNTAKIAKDHGAIVRFEKKQGKGAVVRRMFRDVNADCYILVDGDDTYPPDKAREFVDAVLKDGADMVVGDRLSSTYFSENKRAFHGFGNSFVRWSVNAFFNGQIKDVMTGLRAFSYQFVKSFPILSQGFEIETEMSIWAVDKNLNITNIVTPYKDRPEGSKSKLNTFSDGIKVIRTILRSFRNYHPFSFFSLISLALLLLSTIFFIPILVEYINTGLVPNFPTLIVCGFVVLAAIQSFFAGLILSNIRTQEKRNFEMELNRIKNDYNSKK